MYQDTIWMVYTIYIPYIYHEYTMDIPVRLGYTSYIPDIFIVYTTWYILRYPVHILCLVIFKFRQLSKEQWMLEEVGMHICSMAFQGTNAFVPKSHVLLQDRLYQVYTWIYQVYTRHIPCESQVRAFLVAHQRLEASDWDFLRIFSVLATERQPTRGWGRPKFHNQVLIL